MKSKKRDSIAARLALGDLVVPPRVSWWPRHLVSLLQYLQGRSGKNAQVTKRLLDACKQVGREWGTFIPDGAEGDEAAALMEAHTHCEITLIDMVWGGSSVAELQIEGRKIIDNLLTQSKLYRRALQTFPDARFGTLVTDHVTQLLDCVGAYADGHVRRFSDNVDRWRANSAALAAFTAEWF